MQSAEQLLEAGAPVLDDADGARERGGTSLIEVGEQAIDLHGESGD
jgi:hypothetical protein